MQEKVSAHLKSPARLQLFLTLIVLLVSIAGFALCYHTNQLIRDINKPQFSVDQVYLSEAVAGEQDLVIDYQNVGRADMRWLGIALKLITGNVSDGETINVVLGNPFEAGVSKQSVNKLTVPATPFLAVCARWLDGREILSTSEWYYSLSPHQYEPKVQRYVDASARERALMRDLHPCHDVFGDLK
jgi:hypothetical protein